MSVFTANRVKQDLDGRPSYLHPDTVIDRNGSATEVLRLLATADPEKEMALGAERRAEMSSAYGFGVPSGVPEKSFMFIDGVAFIPIHGILVNRFPYSWGWVTGYNFIRDQLAAATADDDVNLIVFDVNSPGGTVSGMEETAQAIFDARGQKATLAVIDSICYSAAFALGSQADKMVITPSGGTGNVGTIAMRVDVTKMLEIEGIKVTLVYAGEFKADGRPEQPMTDAEKQRIQDSVNASYDKFVAIVARGRGLDEETIRGTEAACYNADDALKIKFVDAIVLPAAAVENALCPDEDADDPDNEDDDPMATKPGEQQTVTGLSAEDVAAREATAEAKGRTEATTAERARIDSILTCDEAKDKQSLARAFAMSSNMTLDEAKVMLKAAASETKPEEGNPLETAMSKVPPSGVGQDGSGSPTDDKTPAAKANAILASQAALTGRKSLATA